MLIPRPRVTVEGSKAAPTFAASSGSLFDPPYIRAPISTDPTTASRGIRYHTIPGVVGLATGACRQDAPLALRA